MERQDKTRQSEKKEQSSDSRSDKVAPKGEMGNRAVSAEKKDQGNRSATTEKKDTGSPAKSTTKKDSDSSGTTQRKGSGSADKKDSNAKK